MSVARLIRVYYFCVHQVGINLSLGNKPRLKTSSLVILLLNTNNIYVGHRGTEGEKMLFPFFFSSFFGMSLMENDW